MRVFRILIGLMLLVPYGIVRLVIGVTGVVLYWSILLTLGTVFFVANAPRILVERCRPKYESASEEKLREFFHEPANYANRHIDEILNAVGVWSQGGDGDYGWSEYVWARPALRVKVVFKDRLVKQVSFRYPREPGRSAEKIWSE